MAKHVALYIHLLAYYIISTFLPLPSHSADPSPLQDFCIADLNSSIHINGFPCKNPSNVTSEDFFYDGMKEEGTIFDMNGVNLTRGSVDQFPGLNTLGISMNRIEIVPGGLNPPHTHPRASQLAMVTQGQLLVGLVTTEDVYYSKEVTAGELFVIPPGLMHFEFNIGKGKAVFFASFNSQNPGIQILPTALFNTTPAIPDEVLIKAFRVNKSIIDLIRSRLSS